jgi:hypothetical protein
MQLQISKQVSSSFLLGLLFVLFNFLLASCSTSHRRPCTDGGQPGREVAAGAEPFRGIKKCYQKQDESGAWVNDGKYFEWYPSEKIAVTGEYKLGKKTGRWFEYDENGKKTSDRYYDEGKVVPAP